MGNRAILVVTNGDYIAPAAIYVHWAGRDGIVEALKAASERKNIRAGDESYALARLVHAVCENEGPTDALSVGVISPPTNLEPATLNAYSQGDGGVCVLDVATGEYKWAGSRPEPGKIDLYNG